MSASNSNTAAIRSNVALPDRYIDAKAASEFLSVGCATLANWRSAGYGPRYTKLSNGRSGAIRYSLAELAAFAADPTGYRARPVAAFNKPQMLKRGGNPRVTPAKARPRRGKGSRGV